MKRIFHLLIIIALSYNARSQVIYPMFLYNMPEHGFLPGRQFEFYPTINSYNFDGLKMRIEVYDDREETRFEKISCSPLELTNTSEFNSNLAVLKIGEYLDTLLPKSGITIDPHNSTILEVRLEAIDARLIGFGFTRVHGLCQIKIRYKGVMQTYCVDITDDDEHAPINSTAFITRSTATRVMVSAAIREVIEQFLIDLKYWP